MSISQSNTAAGHDKLVRSQIWSKEIQRELEEELMAQSIVRMLPEFTDGDKITIPKLYSMSVRNYEEGQPISIDDPTVDEFELIIDKYYQNAYGVYDKYRQDTYYNNVVDSEYPRQQIRAVMERMENDIFLLHKKQTTNDPNTINGQAHRYVGTGTSNAITLDDVWKAKLALDKANVSSVGRKAFVDPQVAYQLGQIDNVIRQDVYGANSHIKDGFGSTKLIGTFAGFEFYQSNMLDEATALDHATGGSLIANMFCGEDAFVGAMRQAPEVEYSRDWERLRDVYNITSRWGLDLFRPESLVTVLTGAVS